MRDWDIKTIVLGYDGSEGADQAADLAAWVARKNDSRILVVTVFQGTYGDALGKRATSEIIQARETADKLVAKLEASGIHAAPEALQGSAGDALLRVAEAREADLIVVGRHGHGGLAGLLLGSTAEYVVRRAKVPVLVAD
jgi:nucleotide-binding universal stress UspA family protein